MTDEYILEIQYPDARHPWEIKDPEPVEIHAYPTKEKEEDNQ